MITLAAGEVPIAGVLLLLSLALLLVGSTAYAIVDFGRHIREPRVSPEGHPACAGYGYSLYGAIKFCPECGRPNGDRAS